MSKEVLCDFFQGNIYDVFTNVMPAKQEKYFSWISTFEYFKFSTLINMILTNFFQNIQSIIIDLLYNVMTL